MIHSLGAVGYLTENKVHPRGRCSLGEVAIVAKNKILHSRYYRSGQWTGQALEVQLKPFEFDMSAFAAAS
jgi:hypothetical protein